jgi:hypothetical protein
MALSAVCLPTSVLTTVETQTEPVDIQPKHVVTEESVRLDHERILMELQLLNLERARRTQLNHRESGMLAFDIFQSVDHQVDLATEIYPEDLNRRQSRIIFIIGTVGQMCTRAAEMRERNRRTAYPEPALTPPNPETK